MHSLLTNTISSFFHDLAPLPLSHTELMKLSNSQLIPSLTYRLIYNSLPENLLNSLDSAIWSYISEQGHLSELTPTKTKYGNRAHLQLGITSLKLKVHQHTVNHITRYLLKEGPKPTNEAVLFALSQPTPAPNLLQSFSVDSANFINISLHNVPNSNPAPLTTIPLYTTIQVQFECFLSTTAPTSYSDTRTKTHPTPSQRWATGTIIKQNPTSTDVDFGDAIMTLKLHHRSSGACGRPSRKRGETASACGTSPKAQPRTHTPPHHPTSVGAPTPATPTTPQEPCAPHNTTRLTPRPAAPPSNPVIQHSTTTGRHARPRPEVTKQTGRRRKPTHTTTSTTTPKGAEPGPDTVGSSPPSARHTRH